MFWTILALLLMVVLGGFISYYGDLQGRRWGKRRVSWFGLRPKHTAIIITSLTGGFIALLSIATVFIAFPTVQRVVLYGERAIEENKRLNVRMAVERQTQSAALKELTNKVQQAQTEYASKLAANNKELATRSQELEDARQKLAPKQAEIALLEKAQFALETTLKQERADIRQKSAELQNITNDNRRATEINEALIRQGKEKTQQIADLSKSVHGLEQAIQKGQQEQAALTRDNHQIQEVIKRMRELGDSLEDSNRAIQSDLARRRADLAAKQEELDKLNGQLNQAYTQIAGTEKAFTQSYHTLRQGEITIRAGAELARRTLPAHLSETEARTQVQSLLEDASDTAAGLYGARRGENNRAVRIVSKRVVTPINTQDAEEPASIDALVANIAASSMPVVVVANSLNNCVRGEQVLVELRPIEVKQVFTKNEVVASRVINAAQTPEHVTEAVAEFLQQDVRSAAVKAGCIPRVNPTTGIAEVGVFNSIALGQLTDHIRRMGGNVRLKAVAAVPTSSADPLDSAHLRLETAPARSGAAATAQARSVNTSPIITGFSGK